MPTVDCYLQDLSRTYANGLPQVEVFVSTGYLNLEAIPAPGVRVPITVVTSTGTYVGGLRNNQGKGWPYICPDLKTASGADIKLAEILRANGVSLSPNQPLQFRLVGGICG